MKTKHGQFKLNQMVMEIPDDTGASRWHGRIVSFADVKMEGWIAPQTMLIINLSNGHYMDNGIYISMMVAHPTNAQAL